MSQATPKTTSTTTLTATISDNEIIARLKKIVGGPNGNSGNVRMVTSVSTPAFSLLSPTPTSGSSDSSSDGYNFWSSSDESPRKHAPFPAPIMERLNLRPPQSPVVGLSSPLPPTHSARKNRNRARKSLSPKPPPSRSSLPPPPGFAPLPPPPGFAQLPPPPLTNTSDESSSNTDTPPSTTQRKTLPVVRTPRRGTHTPSPPPPTTRRTPRRNNTSHSPQRRNNTSHSPQRRNNTSHSPQRRNNTSHSPQRRNNTSHSPQRRNNTSHSPQRRDNTSRSPPHSPRRSKSKSLSPAPSSPRNHPPADLTVIVRRVDLLDGAAALAAKRDKEEEEKVLEEVSVEEKKEGGGGNELVLYPQGFFNGVKCVEQPPSPSPKSPVVSRVKPYKYEDPADVNYQYEDLSNGYFLNNLETYGDDDFFDNTTAPDYGWRYRGRVGDGLGSVAVAHVKTKNKNKKYISSKYSDHPLHPDIPNPYLHVHDKYWAQRHRLFSRFDHGILLDTEGWYSVTPETIADHVAKTVGDMSATMTKVSHPYQGIVILDAFCGCGGNAIAFGRLKLELVSLVVCVDLDREKLRMAAHNAALYNIPRDKLVFVEANTCFVLDKCYNDGGLVYNGTSWSSREQCQGYTIGGLDLLPFHVDAVFMDPPWGGVDYNDLGRNGYDLAKNMKISYHEGNYSNGMVSGSDLLKMAASATKSKLVIYDTPRNTNKTSVGRAALHAGYRGNIKLEEHYLNGRLKTVTYYFGRDFGNLLVGS